LFLIRSLLNNFLVGNHHLRGGSLHLKVLVKEKRWRIYSISFLVWWSVFVQEESSYTADWIKSRESFSIFTRMKYLQRRNPKMFCMKCQNELRSCSCPDINERLAAIASEGKIIFKTCNICGNHHERCHCFISSWRFDLPSVGTFSAEDN